MAIVPVAVLPPYTRTKKGSSTGLSKDAGICRDLKRPSPAVDSPVPREAAASNVIESGIFIVRSGYAAQNWANAPFSGPSADIPCTPLCKV